MKEYRIKIGGRLRNATRLDPDSPLPPRSSSIAVAEPAKHPVDPGIVIRPELGIPVENIPEPPRKPEPIPQIDEAQAEREAERIRIVEQQMKADRDSIQATLSEIKSSLKEMEAKRIFQVTELQQAAVELALTVTAKLLHQEIEVGRFPVEAMIRDMMAELGTEQEVTIRLHPDDLKLLESRLNGEPLFPGQDDPRMVADPKLPRASCRLEGKESMLLSELGSQLHSIRDELLRNLGHAAGT